MLTKEEVNPIELLDQMIENNEDIYETAVSIGIQSENELTVQRWLQGDITMRVEGAYGDGILVKFATALNVNTSTLKQRRTMSAFFELDTRYLFDNLGYSHYREAMRLGNIDDATDALGYASENDIPVWKFAEYINKRLGKDIQTHESCEGTITRTYTQDDGRYFVVKADIDLRMGQVISIRLK